MKYFLLFVFGTYHAGFALRSNSEIDPDDSIRICARRSEGVAYINEDIYSDNDELSSEPYTVKCRANNCYTLWKEDPKNGSITIMGQGKIIY